MSKYRHRPQLDAKLDLGFIGFETYLFTDFEYEFATTWIGLKWYFFKWSGQFRLYSPYKDRH